MHRMRDGARLAVDAWLPEEYVAGDRLPTAMRATRYWRAQDLGSLTRAQVRFTSLTPRDMMDPSVQAFNEAGYAVVLVDVRGSGASFGSRTAEGDPTWEVFRDRRRPSGVTIPMKVR